LPPCQQVGDRHDNKFDFQVCEMMAVAKISAAFPNQPKQALSEFKRAFNSRDLKMIDENFAPR